MTTAEHTHSWAVDRMQAGFSCPCGQPGWDWQQDEIRELELLLHNNRAVRIEAEDQLYALKADNARLRAELQAREATVKAMRATLTDFADPDHWTQNDEGEWIWYGTYPPFERPTLDLVGPLAPSALDAVPRRAGTEEIRIYPHRFTEPCGSQEGADACWYDGKPRLDPIHAAEIREPAASPEPPTEAERHIRYARAARALPEDQAPAASPEDVA